MYTMHAHGNVAEVANFAETFFTEIRSDTLMSTDFLVNLDKYLVYILLQPKFVQITHNSNPKSVLKITPTIKEATFYSILIQYPNRYIQISICSFI